MKFLAHRGERFLHCGILVFATLLFLDSANLDDLFTTMAVVHSDEDAIARLSSDPQETGGPRVSPVSERMADSRYLGTLPSGIRPRYFILDQDSPSTNDESFELAGFHVFPAHQLTLSYHSPTFTSLLYLKLRTLLI